MHQSISRERRLVFQEVPRSEEQLPQQQSQLPEQKEQLAARYGPRLQEAIDKLLPRDEGQLKEWRERTHEPFTYDGKTYQIKFLDKEAGEGKRLIGLNLSTDHEVRIQNQNRSINIVVSRDHFMKSLLNEQISIYRIDRNAPERSGGSDPSLYQVVFDPLKITVEFDTKSGELFGDTRGKSSTAAELQQVLAFVETELPKITLAAKVEGTSKEDL